jgi:hypothetical protein
VTLPYHAGPPVDRCTRYNPSVKCAQREKAQADGEIFYSEKYGGWIYPAENRKPPQILRDKWLAPFTWTFCPWCGGSLPDTESAIERLMLPPPPESEDGC